MLENEVKVGMMVRVPDHTKNLEPTTSIVRIKKFYLIKQEMMK